MQEIELYRSDYVEVNGATITVSADSAEPVKLTIVGPYSVMSP